MGYVLDGCHVTPDGEVWMEYGHFEPLKSDADACMVLDKLLERFEIDMSSDGTGWGITLFRLGGEKYGDNGELVYEWVQSTPGGQSYSRRRCICMAALKAVTGSM